MSTRDTIRGIEAKAKAYGRKAKNVVGNLTGRRETQKIGEYVRKATRK